jgi:branched-chain amino acid transport system substrate-binding protein
VGPELPSAQGATRVGVSATAIKWGLHAPKTLQGVPWGLADDVLQGVRIYLNQVNEQKVNGRTIVEYFADDRYDTNSGAAAGDKLITDDKVFFASGTLGVDQIAQVAKKARASKPVPTPYIAGGGSESKFKDIGMYQVAGSYDSHLLALVKFLDAEAAKPACPTPYDGKCPLDKSPYGGHGTTKLKIGISSLNSEYIKPAVDATIAAIKASKHLEFSKSVTVEKPEGGAQTTYTNQVLQLSDSDVVIPAQDPLSTSGEVRECRAQAATCHFKWAMSDFAHDGDVDLALMGGTWTGYRGLSGGCYYLAWNQPVSAKCAKLKNAHDLWVTGTDPNVDNGGGDKGTGAKQSESTWQDKGQAGAAGYQLVHIWLKALKDAGPDLTREKFVAALNAYSNYDDLTSVPITYAGSDNKAKGINGFAIYQAGPPDSSKPKKVGWSMISDGLIGF